MSYCRGGYWYRSRRSGHRVTTEYLGGGEIAALLGEIETLEREERQEALAERKAQTDLDAKLDARSTELQELTARILVARGYHKHKGQWRKRRMANQIVKKGGVLADLKELADQHNIKFMPPLQTEGEALAERVMHPSEVIEHKVDRLTELMARPRLSYEEQLETGDLFDQYEHVWCTRFFERGAVPDLPNCNGGTRHVYDCKIKELSKPEDGELERTLVRHVALCAVHFQMTSQRYDSFVMSAESVAVPIALFWERQMSATQRRYLLAIRMLAKVRRLARPSLQLNIGQKQVNVAG